MQLFSYPGCRSCLVKACCGIVCEDYIRHVFETRGIIISDLISLQDAELEIMYHLIDDDKPENWRDSFRGK